MSIALMYIRKGSEIKNEHLSPRPEQPSVIFHVLLFATPALPSYLRWTPPLTSSCFQPAWILLTEWCKCKQTQWQRGSRRCQWFPTGPRWTPLAPLFPLAPEPPLYWRWSSPFWPPHLCLQGAYLWRNRRAMWDKQSARHGSLFPFLRAAHSLLTFSDGHQKCSSRGQTERSVEQHRGWDFSLHWLPSCECGVMNTKEDVSPHLRDGFPPQKMIFPCGAATTGWLFGSWDD